MTSETLAQPTARSWTAADRFVAVAAFPLVLGGALAIAIPLLRDGVAPALATAPLIALGAVVVLALERFFPHHRSWLHSHDDVLVDLAHAFSVNLTGLLIQPLIAAAGLALAALLAGQIGFALWPTGWPLLAQLPLALVVAELPKYWVHRLEHEQDWLWRFHATHHSVPRLYWLNAARFHPVDIALDAIVGLTTLIALGCGLELIALFTLVSAVHGYFQHANLKIRIGPLNYFFSMAELHRWHHSKATREANHNYGQNVIVWDLVFGSFFLPGDREPPEEVGLADLPSFPTRFWSQLASPFRWRRIREESGSLLNATGPSSARS